MKAVIQKTTNANVSVDNNIIGEINNGLVVLLGVAEGDAEQDADYIIEKLVNLRIFSDTENKINLSLIDTKGSILLISQFTLLADTKKGRRPSFVKAASPELAQQLYLYCKQQLESQNIKVATGEFGANMQVTLTNDGPVTIILDSREK